MATFEQRKIRDGNFLYTKNQLNPPPYKERVIIIGKRMKKLVFHFVGLVCLLSLVSCRHSTTNPRESSETSEISFEVNPAHLRPQFRGKVFCNNVKYGPKNGCIINLVVEGKVKSRCGHPGAISEITWQFIAHRDGKDIYLFQRRFPVDSENPQTQSKQVAFAGESIVVFQDEVQKISVIPESSEEYTGVHSGESEAVEKR
ncbi:hypothetical protein J7M23_07950 [Candidatus Sumerlaeota bacterium]|nr:hypothetical protein [Candidatus Sumerlaeota bacterium]